MFDFRPVSTALPSQRYDAGGRFLYSVDVAHGVVEGQAENLDVEVNGIASKVALRPAPVTVFYDESGIGGQNKIARLAFDKLESAPL